MILACPNCMARFRVEVEALGATGRRVRCSKCHHVWRAEPPGYVVEVLHAEPEPPDAGEGADREPWKPQLPVPAGRPPRSRAPSLRVWVVSLAALALCIVGYEARHAIQKEWPWLAPVYKALGFEPEGGQGAKPVRPE